MLQYTRYPTRMFDSSSLDKLLALALSIASASFEAAVRGVQLLSLLTGVTPAVIVAGIAGLIPFILIVIPIAFSDRRDRRPRHEVLTAWPSHGSGLNTVPEAPSHATITSRLFDPSQHVEKQRLELTDQAGELPQDNFCEAPSEPSRTDVSPYEHDNSSTLGREVFSSAMKVTGDFLIGSTTQVTTLIGRSVSQVQEKLFSFSTARAKSRCSLDCYWVRVCREGPKDYVLSCLGWYPWQCKHCLTCSYFRRRT